MANNVTITGIKYGTTTITASYTDGGVTKTSSVQNFQVTAIAPSLSFAASGGTITYNGNSQVIGTVSYNGDGTAYYYIQKATSQPSTPAANASGWTAITNGGSISATDAGTYYVFLKAVGASGGNYTGVDPKQGGNKAINKRTVTVSTTPVVKSATIQYTGSAQALLSTNGAASTGGQMYYYVSTSSTAPTVTSGSAPGTGWSTTAPSKTDVGTYYIWYYVYIADKDNNQAGTNVESVKSLGSKKIEQRTGAAPTFSASSVSATCTQGSNATTSPAVNAGAFSAASAGHSGSITYAIQNVVKDGTSTSLSGWTMTSNTSRIITVPANTLPGTYKVTVRANEGETTTDTSSYTDKVITVTLSKGSQSLSLDKTTLSLNVPNTGTITASGYVGTLSVSSNATNIATATNAAASTITAVSTGTAEASSAQATITFTAAATDYLNSVSKTATVTVSKRSGAAPTFANDSVSATLVQAGSARTTSAFGAATAGHSGSISYSIVSAKKSGSSTSLTGWTVDSTNRTIGVPANTAYGTYTVVIRANEGATATDSSSYKDATITVTLNRGTQTLNLDKDSLTLTVPNTGTITASGYAGTLSVSSNATGVATATNKAASTITAVSAGNATNTSGSATISFTAAATDYVNSVTKTATVTVNRRAGSAPTFANGSVSATCVQGSNASTSPAVNASTFSAATATHSGGLTYSIVSVVKSGTSTALTGWTMTSNTSRVITVPANTLPGTYNVTVRATEAQTAYDTSSYTDKVITVTLSKGTQSLTIDNSTLTLTVPNTGTITASGYVGTLSATSGTTSVATVSTNTSTKKVTVTAVANGTSTVTVKAAATDYLNEVTKTCAVTVNRRNGAAPTFNASTVTATCDQAGNAKTTTAFTAATAGHSGSLSYEFRSAVLDGSSTTLSGWSVNSTNRTISIPANTPAGTYKVTVRANEGETSTDTSSYKDAVITVTLSKGTQTLTLDKETLTLTYPTTGTIEATGYAGTLSVSSGTTSVATATNTATSTITPVGAGQSTITFTAAATDYVNSVTKTATVTVNRRTGAAPTFNNSTVTATCSQDASAKTTTAFTAATAGHSGSLSYSIVSVTNSGGSSLTGWSINGTNGSSRTINIPANTPAGTYTVVVKATEGQTSTDTSSEKNATITVTLSKGTQTLTLTGSPSDYTSTYSSGGTITASGHAGTISATSGTTSVATVSTNGNVVTVTCVKAGTSSITVTAAATDYVNSVSKSQTWTINKASRSGEVKSAGDVTSMTYGTTLQMSVTGNTESGTITWTVTNGTGTATINSSGVLTATKPGTVTVNASVAATTNYAAYTPTSKTITINKATLTVTEVNYSGTWDNASHASTVKVTKSDWDGKTIVSGTSTSYGTTVTNAGQPNTAYTLKSASAYTASTTIYYKITGGTYYNDYTDSVTFAINKASTSLPSTWVGASVEYHETASLTITPATPTGGSYKYRYDVNNGTSWTETTTMPTRTSIGTTAVQVMVVGDSNHESTGWSNKVTLTVYASDDAHMTVDITSSTLTYNGTTCSNGSAQTIASVATSNDSKYHGVGSYTLGYYKNTSAATSESQITWATANTSLTATNAGTYHIYYKFSPDGNHENSNVPDSGFETATYVGSKVINQKAGSLSASTVNRTYNGTNGNNGTPQTLAQNASATGTYYFGFGSSASSSPSSWGAANTLPTQTNVGTSYIWMKCDASSNGNCAAVAATYIGTAVMSPKTSTVTYSVNTPIEEFCTLEPEPASNWTRTSYHPEIATSSATGTGTGSISYSISQSGWSISNDGKTITIPSTASAGEYTFTVTATQAANGNWDTGSKANTIKVTLLANALESITLSLAANTIAFNGTTTGTVVAVYTNGADKDVTASATYSSNPTGIVTITK